MAYRITARWIVLQVVPFEAKTVFDPGQSVYLCHFCDHLSSQLRELHLFYILLAAQADTLVLCKVFGVYELGAKVDPFHNCLMGAFLFGEKRT